MQSAAVVHVIFAGEVRSPTVTLKVPQIIGPSPVQTGSSVAAFSWSTDGVPLATAYAAVQALLTMPRIAVLAAFLAESVVDVKLGIATAARIPTITITMTSSIKVKPFCVAMLICFDKLHII